ncbi:MAG: hypothetical protein LBI70_03405 [Rickettsiales bacterium]|jgi:hypothetical protein|nr:hypothetical protein [Rickettsiales bacterium]
MKYRELLLENLIRDWVDMDNSSFGVHMDGFIGTNDTITYLREGFGMFRELIQICRENSWLDNIIPYFCLYLKDSEKLMIDPNRLLLKNVGHLIRNLDKGTPPEIYMTKKIGCSGIFGGRGQNDSEFETHIYPMSNELLYKLFGFPDKTLTKSVYIKCVCFRNDENYLSDNIPIYGGYIDIEYNRNNTRITRDFSRLVLQNKNDLEFYRKYRLEYGD